MLGYPCVFSHHDSLIPILACRVEKAVHLYDVLVKESSLIIETKWKVSPYSLNETFKYKLLILELYN